MTFDCDASLALQIHVVEHLTFGYLNRFRVLQQTVGQRRLAMINMGNNAKIPYILHI